MYLHLELFIVSHSRNTGHSWAQGLFRTFGLGFLSLGGGSHLTLSNVGQMGLDREFQRFTDSSRASLVAQMVKNLPAMQEIQVQFRSGRSPGEGNGNPLQYSRLENSMDRGAWWATVHGVAHSWTWLTITHTHTHTLTAPVGRRWRWTRVELTTVQPKKMSNPASPAKGSTDGLILARLLWMDSYPIQEKFQDKQQLSRSHSSLYLKINNLVYGYFPLCNQDLLSTSDFCFSGKGRLLVGKASADSFWWSGLRIA